MPHAKAALAPRKQAQQDRSRRRVDLILSVTKELLNEVPAHQVNTRLIAERAGVPVGSIYQFFPKKEAIFYELFRRWLDATVATLDRVLEALPADASYPDCLDAFLRALAEPELNSQPNWKLRFAMSESKELAELEARHKQEVLARVTRFQSHFASAPPAHLRAPVMMLQNEYTVVSLMSLSLMAGTAEEEKIYQMCKALLLIVYDFDRWEGLVDGDLLGKGRTGG